MLSYHVQIRTKLGSVRSKTIQAESEEAAISIAKSNFPLHESVWVEGDPQETPAETGPSQESLNRISDMKRAAEMHKAQAKRTEGLIWFGVGAFLTIVTFLFVRNAFIISFGPIIWGFFIYKKADSRIKTLAEEQAAGLPFIER
ncbi:hypothetical protein VDG1235_4 [Verrucomicrobiia bacterium DG1235]|nr:hypothetical protein VDG1235_4 [Verrucomicrobiae bacterium DG1235]